MPRKILITGANGALGKALRDGLAGAYPVFRLTHRRPLDVPPREGEEFALAQLESLDDMEAAMDGIDTVVHLGARSDEDDWNVIRSANIDGTFNVFEAARRRGVRRVVFGGTHHVVGFHRREHVLDPETPIRPDSRYGVSKAFGEALARMYADKYGIEVVNIRIGVAQPVPPHQRSLWLWLGYEDWVSLVRAAIDAPDGLHYVTVYGVSANSRRPCDDPGAKVIGWTPRQNAEDYLEEVNRKQRPEDEPAVERPFHGGQMCGREFVGDLDAID